MMREFYAPPPVKRQRTGLMFLVGYMLGFCTRESARIAFGLLKTGAIADLIKQAMSNTWIMTSGLVIIAIVALVTALVIIEVIKRK